MSAISPITEIDAVLRQFVLENQPVHDIGALVVKLIENSLDAQSTSISIEVSSTTSAACVAVFDNGHGIHQAGVDNLGRHYHSFRSGYVQSTDRLNIESGQRTVNAVSSACR
jgi:sensor histidine kinase regulating citrate/malate metabolism